MLGTILMTGTELVGAIGIGTMTGTAATALIPEGASVATKVCCGVGLGMGTLATERVIVREFEGYCNDVKKTVGAMKVARNEQKKIREMERRKKELELQQELEKLANEQAMKVANK